MQLNCFVLIDSEDNEDIVRWSHFWGLQTPTFFRGLCLYCRFSVILLNWILRGKFEKTIVYGQMYGSFRNLPKKWCRKKNSQKTFWRKTLAVSEFSIDVHQELEINAGQDEGTQPWTCPSGSKSTFWRHVGALGASAVSDSSGADAEVSVGILPRLRTKTRMLIFRWWN